MDTIRNWYNGLSDQWKATLRSAWQGLIGAIGIMVLAVISEAVDVLNGGDLQESLADLSIAAKAFGVALAGIATGVVTFWMNRGAKGAVYGAQQATVDTPPEFP